MTFGRWVLVSLQVVFCGLFSLIALLALYSVSSDNANLQIDEPCDSIVVYAFLTLWVSAVLCWSAFCLVFAVFLRRRGQATNSLTQLFAIFRLMIPVWGVGYYQRTVHETHRRIRGGTVRSAMSEAERR